MLFDNYLVFFLNFFYHSFYIFQTHIWNYSQILTLKNLEEKEKENQILSLYIYSLGDQINKNVGEIRVVGNDN